MLLDVQARVELLKDLSNLFILQFIPNCYPFVCDLGIFSLSTFL